MLRKCICAGVLSCCGTMQLVQMFSMPHIFFKTTTVGDKKENTALKMEEGCDSDSVTEPRVPSEN